jgi:hypothetical protein
MDINPSDFEGSPYDPTKRPATREELIRSQHELQRPHISAAEAIALTAEVLGLPAIEVAQEVAVAAIEANLPLAACDCGDCLGKAAAAVLAAVGYKEKV